MLDADLAALYEVPTKVLKQAVRRNTERFPEDFMFELTTEEIGCLRSQFVTSKKTGRGGARCLPFAFTEQGVAMLSSVLSSKQAIAVNIMIIRIFVLMVDQAYTYKELSEKLDALETRCDEQFAGVYKALNLLMGDDRDHMKNRKMIGIDQA